ncbi:MAG: class I SAM-dependent methyltransferase [Chlamydiia bacterium]|nr:class I SAM-dependent methyltransferase [Chlamydiia bacterium]
MSSWNDAKPWYSSIVGDKGHYYHQALIFPNLFKLLRLSPGSALLDLGCGQGVLARNLPQETAYVGVDLSEKLIDEAKKHTKHSQCTFLVADATKKLPIQKTNFDYAVCILSLQNMENMSGAIQNAANHLKQRGELILVLNHPCFRIPRQSSWGIDAQAKLQYRRINRYMTPLKIPLQIHPSKGEESALTYSFHHSLSDFSQALSAHGFSIRAIEEWCSDKKSTGANQRMENLARKEIPLFLTLVATLVHKE